LIPNESLGTNPASINVAGAFSFMINERTYTLPVIERKEALAGINREQLSDVLYKVSKESAGTYAYNPPPVNPPPVNPPPVNPPPVNPPSGQQRPNNGNDLFRAEPGIRYGVQIAAGHKRVNIPLTFKNYRLTYDVKREEHEGWYKYIIGTFGKYRDARDCRVHLSNTTAIKDAFVTAYNNGKRITVQEALMALNEKWIP
jgi:hypothetical protein